MNPITKNKDIMLSKLVIRDEKQKDIFSKNTNRKTHDKHLKKNNDFVSFHQDDKSYIYNLDILDKDKNTNYSGRVHLCLFTVVTSGLQPFLLYLLYKNKENKLIFPYIKANTSTFFNNLENKIKYISDDSNFSFKGNILFNNELYVFYQLDNDVYNVDLILNNDKWLFSLITEICYQKSVLTFSLDKKVFDFFMNNQSLCKLFDSNNKQYNSPHCLYHGSNMEHMDYFVYMGPKKNDLHSYFGPFYEFGSYETSSRHGGWSLNFKPHSEESFSHNNESVLLTDNDFGRYINPGIIRFAVFLGKMKTFLNNENKSQGSWSKKFNSVHSSELTINQINDNLQYKYNIAVKNITQQFTLSYHKLDKSNMDEMYESNKIYTIE